MKIYRCNKCGKEEERMVTNFFVVYVYGGTQEKDEKMTFHLCYDCAVLFLENTPPNKDL